jgi:hypothetical protein
MRTVRQIFWVNCAFSVLLACFLMTLEPVKAQQVEFIFSRVNDISLSEQELLQTRIRLNAPQAVLAVLEGVLKHQEAGIVARFQIPSARLIPGENLLSNLFRQGGGAVTYTNADFKDLTSFTGVYPSGMYEWCLNLELQYDPVLFVSDCGLFQKIEEFNIWLEFPENKAEIEDKSPLFSWGSSALGGGYRDMRYHILVVELFPGQSLQEAVKRNMPLMQLRDEVMTTAYYPVTARPLEIGKRYAWQVSASKGKFLLGSTSVWEFSLLEDSLILNVNKDQPHVDLNNFMIGEKIYAVGEIKLRYFEQRTADTLHFKLLDEKEKQIELPDKEMPLRMGENRFTLELDDKIRLKHGARYTLHVLYKNKLTKVSFLYVDPMRVRQ